MSFTNANDVRNETWLAGNPNVTNDTIEKYVVMAHSIVISSVAWKYTVTDLTGSLFTWSQAEQFLVTAEVLIASGLLIQKEFWSEVVSQWDGEKRIKQWKDMLMQLYDTKMPTILIDINWSEFTRKSVVQAWWIVGADYTATDPYFTVWQKW